MPLNVTGLSKRIGNNWVLRDVNLSLDDGAVVGLIGHPGVGRSCLLRLIAGLEKPSTGSISTSGRLAEYVGHVNSGLSKLFGKSTPTSATQEAALGEVIEKAGDRVYLLDEPLYLVPTERQHQLLTEFKHKVKENKAIAIVVLNNLEAMFAFSDQIALLEKGEIIQIGTPQQMYEAPETRAAAILTGRSNLIRAMRVTFSNQGSVEFQTLSGAHRLQADIKERSRMGTMTSALNLLIRPEHISLSFGASFPEDNLLRARVTGVEYLGATTRVFLDANGLKLEALVLRLVGLDIGSECMVGLPPDRISVLRD
jgi:ABC-type sugar transport system ATPase subunit